MERVGILYIVNCSSYDVDGNDEKWVERRWVVGFRLVLVVRYRLVL